MTNIVGIWLKLIGLPERARKLRARLDSLASPELDKLFGPEPPQSPETVLYGAETSRKLYIDPDYRPALDAWDMGSVSKSDLRRYCRWIELGRYTGPIFYPDASWQSHVRVLTKQNALKAELLLRTPGRQTWESLESNDREQGPA
jgi:hypothetical protein